MKKILVTSCLIAFIYLNALAQISDSISAEYKNLKDNVDSEYSEFKNAVWKEFEAIKIANGFKKPKPKTPPKVEPEKIPDQPQAITPNPIVIEPDITIPLDDFSERRSSNFEDELKKIAAISTNSIDVDFYNSSFKLYYDNIDFKLDTVSRKSITSSFKYFTNNAETVDKIAIQLIEYASIMQLNDYAFMQLVRKTAITIFNNDINKANLFTWFVLNANKYDCKIGYTKDNYIFLLVPSTLKIYRTAFIVVDDKRYYAMSFSLEEEKKVTMKFRTYTKNPLKSDKTIDFVIVNPPKINTKYGKTSRRMPNIDKTFNIDYNKSYVQLLKNMPILDYPAYFHFPMNKKTFENIKSQFEPYLKGKDDVEKVSFILKFVQQGFPYKYDKDNFGRNEQPLSPEEVLCYSHCDCEDHAALFAYLVTTLTNCEVVGVLYKDHATTAVKFPEKRLNGYYLPAPYDNYILCESTVGFGVIPIGTIGAEYIGVQPEQVFKVNKELIMKGLK